MKAKLVGDIVNVSRGQTADFVQCTLRLTGNFDHRERAAKAAKMDAILHLTPQLANQLPFGTRFTVVVECDDPPGFVKEETPTT